MHFRSGSTGLPRRLRRGEAAKRITKSADLMRKAPPKRGFNCPHACRRYSPHSHNVEPGRRFDELGRILRQAFRLRPSRLTLASWPRPRSVSRRPPSGSRSRCEPPCVVQPNRSPPRRFSGEVLLRAAANRCCVGLSTQKPTERVGVERWVCHLPGKPDRSNLAPLRRGFFCRYPRASGRRAGAGQIVRALQKLTARPARLHAARQQSTHPSKPHVFRMPHLSWTRNNPHPHSRPRAAANRGLHPLSRNRPPRARSSPASAR